MLKKWLFLLLTIGLFWGGVGGLMAQENPVASIEPKAKELMTQAVYNLLEAKTLRFEFKMSATIDYIDGQNLSQFKILTEGVCQPPGVSYFKTRARGQAVELYQYEGLVISRDNPEREWIQASNVQSLPLPRDTMTLFMDNLEYARLSHKASVKGHECQILDIGLTQAGLKKLIATQAPEIVIDGTRPQIAKLSVAIGTADGNIYKLSYTMAAVAKADKAQKDSVVPENVSTRIEVSALVFDYNKDVVLEIPTAVKKLLQIEEAVEETIEEPGEKSSEESSEIHEEESTKE